MKHALIIALLTFVTCSSFAQGYGCKDPNMIHFSSFEKPIPTSNGHEDCTYVKKVHPSTELAEAAVTGNLQGVVAALSKGQNPNTYVWDYHLCMDSANMAYGYYPCQRAMPLLVYAAENNLVEITRALLSDSRTVVANKTVSAYSLKTIYHWSSKDLTEPPIVLTMYKEVGLSVLQEDALLVASSKNHYAIVDLLLKHKGVNTSSFHPWYGGALNVAAFNNNVETLKVLLKDGRCNPNFINPHSHMYLNGSYYEARDFERSTTPLMSAIMEEKLEAVKILLTDPRVRTKILDYKTTQGHTALDVAFKEGNGEILQLVSDAVNSLH